MYSGENRRIKPGNADSALKVLLCCMATFSRYWLCKGFMDKSMRPDRKEDKTKKKWLDNIRTDGKVLVVSLSVGERLANNKHIYDKLRKILKFMKIHH